MTELDTVVFNVCGKKIKILKKTILQRSRGLLYDLIQEFKDNEEFFIDENRIIFDAILDYYRTALIVKPENINQILWENRIDYWGISISYSSTDYHLYFIKPHINRINKDTGMCFVGMSELNLDLKKFGIDSFFMFVYENIIHIPIGITKENKLAIIDNQHKLSTIKNYDQLIRHRTYRKIKKSDITTIKEWLYSVRGKDRDNNLESSFFNGLM